jgi:hypothetical protein
MTGQLAHNGTRAELGVGGGGAKLGQKREFFFTFYLSYFITFGACENFNSRYLSKESVLYIIILPNNVHFKGRNKTSLGFYF